MAADQKKETEKLRNQFAADIKQKQEEHQKNIDKMHQQLENTKAETAAEQLQLRKDFDEELALSLFIS